MYMQYRNASVSPVLRRDSVMLQLEEDCVVEGLVVVQALVDHLFHYKIVILLVRNRYL